ncbi:MAG: zinc ribbon domain-containing protein [Candidatus Zixiibacteriota bacterium]
MPLYEYSCKECGHRFEELVSSMSAENPPCPSCGNKQTDKLLSTFAASTGATSTTPSCGMKGGCGGRGFT